MPIFSSKCQKLKSSEAKSIKIMTHVSGVYVLRHGRLYICIYVYDGRTGASDGSSADCKIGPITVRPNLLSAPKTLGNWTDGRPHTRRHSVLTFLRVCSAV